MKESGAKKEGEKGVFGALIVPQCNSGTKSLGKISAN